jgi:hypothetical protein
VLPGEFHRVFVQDRRSSPPQFAKDHSEFQDNVLAKARYLFSPSIPALKTSKRSPASWRNKPSAIWLRAELPVQRMRTRFLSGMAGLRPRYDRRLLSEQPWVVTARAIERAVWRRLPRKLRKNESGSIGGPNASEGIRSGPSERDCRVRERSGSRKPIRSGNVASDGERHSGRP